MLFYVAIALSPLFVLMAALFIVFGKRNTKKEGQQVAEEEPIYERPRRVSVVARGPKVQRATDPSF